MTEATRTQPAPGSSNDPKTSATENADYISVDIYDQTYHLRGDDPDYIHRLADIVDAKMRAVASHGKTVDSFASPSSRPSTSPTSSSPSSSGTTPLAARPTNPAPPSARAPTR